jgi:hypothetical protein
MNRPHVCAGRSNIRFGAPSPLAALSLAAVVVIPAAQAGPAGVLARADREHLSQSLGDSTLAPLGTL